MFEGNAFALQVANDIALEGMTILTGPNMVGPLLRVKCAICLLSPLFSLRSLSSLSLSVLSLSVSLLFLFLPFLEPIFFFPPYYVVGND